MGKVRLDALEGVVGSHVNMGALEELLEVAHVVAAVVERYRMSIYDALIVAAALASECSILWTEDLQHGQRECRPV